MTKLGDVPKNSSLKLLTSADVCAELRIDRSTLSRWVASGRIAAATKLPGKRGPFLFAPAEVARLRTEITEAVS